MDVENRYESEKFWKKLWQRKHSQPVSRSLASPATSLVLRPTRCVHRILALYILRTAQGTRTFLTTVGHPARLLTSQTWRTLPCFRSPITYPLIFSPPCLHKGEGAAAYRACSPLRSGPHNALETSCLCPLRQLLSSDELVTRWSRPCHYQRSTPRATVATAKHHS